MQMLFGGICCCVVLAQKCFVLLHMLQIEGSARDVTISVDKTGQQPATPQWMVRSLLR